MRKPNSRGDVNELVASVFFILDGGGKKETIVADYMEEVSLKTKRKGIKGGKEHVPLVPLLFFASDAYHHRLDF